MPPLWELAGNPLYLTLLAMLIEDGEELPARRAQLYGLIFDFLLDGKHRAGVEAIEPRSVVEDALCHLAWGMTEDNRDAAPAKTLARQLWAAPSLRGALSDTEWSGRPQAKLRCLLARSAGNSMIPCRRLPMIGKALATLAAFSAVR